MDKWVRLNKFLAERLGLSRREADAAISAGKVTIDGEKAALGALERRAGALPGPVPTGPPDAPQQAHRLAAFAAVDVDARGNQRCRDRNILHDAGSCPAWLLSEQGLPSSQPSQ